MVTKASLVKRFLRAQTGVPVDFSLDRFLETFIGGIPFQGELIFK